MQNFEYESLDIIVGMLDELIKQTRRPLPPSPTTFYRFPHLPIELKVKIWRERCEIIGQAVRFLISYAPILRWVKVMMFQFSYPLELVYTLDIL